MNLYPQFRSSLSRLLAALEWTLLGITAVAQVLMAIKQSSPWPMGINMLGLGLFTILGLVKPQGWLWSSIYTLVEFGLILGLGFFGNLPVPMMLFVVLVIRNCSITQGLSRSIVAGLAFLCAVILQSHRLYHQNLLIAVPFEQIGNVWLGFILIFGLVILFLHLLVDAALQERYGQEQLAIANVRLRQYALRVEELATVQERNRIARDIHDSMGHSLTVFSIHLEGALRLLQSNPTKAEALLREIKQLNAQTLQEVRQSVTALRSDPLQERSLRSAIADLEHEFQRSTGILPQSMIQLQQPLAHELNVAIYRIVQESLNNVCKYAAATAVELSIVHGNNQLQVTVRDNGRGFAIDQNTTGFGLQGMQERTLALSGQLQIITAPQQGCLVRATFPM
jgi:signal transduction histidine kinase